MHIFGSLSIPVTGDSGKNGGIFTRRVLEALKNKG